MGSGCTVKVTQSSLHRQDYTVKARFIILACNLCLSCSSCTCCLAVCKSSMLVQPVNNRCVESVHRCAHIYGHCTSVWPTSHTLQRAAGPAASSFFAVPAGPSSSGAPDASDFGFSTADDNNAPNAAAAEGQTGPSSSPPPPQPPLPPSTPPPLKVAGAEARSAPFTSPPWQPSPWSSASTGQYPYLAIIHSSWPVLFLFGSISCHCM